MKSSSNQTDEDEFILIGRVTGAHGIRGGLKIRSHTESMDLYRLGEAIRVALPDGSTKNFIAEWVRPHGGGLRLGLESVNDRNQAESLVGSSLYVEKGRLPVLEEDTYYWHELIGLRVFDTDGVFLGGLEEVIPTPANDVYVVKAETEERTKELLIPAVGHVVRLIDLERGTMVVDPPEGL